MHYLLLLTFFMMQPAIHPDIQEEEYINWSASRRLSWQDFKSVPDKNSNAAASTSTSISVEFKISNKKITYHITCRFSKTKSWVKLKNDHILKHEQGHFNIAELYARKLNKALNEYIQKQKGNHDELNKLYYDIMKEKEKLQDKYDKETDFSRDRKKQEAWLKQIDFMLLELSAFANYS